MYRLTNFVVATTARRGTRAGDLPAGQARRHFNDR